MGEGDVKEISQPDMTWNVIADEKKAQTFIGEMVSCMFDEGGRLEVEVKIF